MSFNSFSVTRDLQEAAIFLRFYPKGLEEPLLQGCQLLVFPPEGTSISQRKLHGILKIH